MVPDVLVAARGFGCFCCGALFWMFLLWRLVSDVFIDIYNLNCCSFSCYFFDYRNNLDYVQLILELKFM